VPIFHFLTGFEISMKFCVSCYYKKKTFLLSEKHFWATLRPNGLGSSKKWSVFLQKCLRFKIFIHFWVIILHFLKNSKNKYTLLHRSYLISNVMKHPLFIYFKKSVKDGPAFLFPIQSNAKRECEICRIFYLFFFTVYRLEFATLFRSAK